MRKSINMVENERIDSICAQYKITNYTINLDGTIDIDGSVDLNNRNLTKLPLRFGVVSGNFLCCLNQLTTLVGSPRTVGGDFYSYSNKLLQNLIGSPVSVGGKFRCSFSGLTSLEGSPANVGKLYDCISNPNLNNTYSGGVDIEVGGGFKSINTKLPLQIVNNIKHIKTILKYQRYFSIWNDDLSLNINNFNDLITDIEEGLE